MNALAYDIAPATMQRPSFTESVINALNECGGLNDRRIAASWMRSRFPPDACAVYLKHLFPAA